MAVQNLNFAETLCMVSKSKPREAGQLPGWRLLSFSFRCLLWSCWIIFDAALGAAHDNTMSHVRRGNAGFPSHKLPQTLAFWQKLMLS